MNRTRRSELARETLAIIERGSYTAPSDSTIELRSAMDAMLAETRVYEPEQLLALERALTPAPRQTQVAVTTETTLAAAARLTGESSEPVLALNFASAKNPGGGFLEGSQAQEESLARSSALYASLLRGESFYRRNRACGTCLYTDHMIYSPRVPVFRNDAGQLLEAPFTVSILTAPAVNAGALKESERPQLDEVMRRRSQLVLTLALAHGYSRLVLGAWGCGVFRNDPAQVAGWFAEHLNGSVAGAFAQVVFAVYDSSPEQSTKRAFDETFGGR